MAIETITFSCPACGIKLTVPSSLAGVSGPCPTCRAQIQAPHPPLASAPANFQLVAIPVPPATLPPPPAATDPIAAPIPEPPHSEPQPESCKTAGLADHVDPIATPIPEQNRRSQAASSTLPPQLQRKSRLIRLLIPLLFLIASVAVGFGVATLIRNRSKESPKKPPRTRTIVLPEPGTSSVPDQSKSEPIPSLPFPAPDQS